MKPDWRPISLEKNPGEAAAWGLGGSPPSCWGVCSCCCCCCCWVSWQRRARPSSCSSCSSSDWSSSSKSSTSLSDSDASASAMGSSRAALAAAVAVHSRSLGMAASAGIAMPTAASILSWMAAVTAAAMASLAMRLTSSRARSAGSRGGGAAAELCLDLIGCRVCRVGGVGRPMLRSSSSSPLVPAPLSSDGNSGSPPINASSLSRLKVPLSVQVTSETSVSDTDMSLHTELAEAEVQFLQNRLQPRAELLGGDQRPQEDSQN
ncbi:hypothetical protein CRUP_014428 [Coryphaenoides rupestris]|nr:hypothetical protein CRUP_014428 [Coryphaenoides rupestris]